MYIHTYHTYTPTYTGCPKKNKTLCLLNISATKYLIFKPFFSPENGDPYARVDYSNIFKRCLGAEILKKQNQGTLDRKGPSRVPSWSKLTNFFT